MLYNQQNPHGGDVYAAPVLLDFSANINPFGTPPAVLDAMQRALPLVRQYPDPYCRALRAAIAAHENVRPLDVLCGSGAAELIYAFCDAVRARNALTLAPTFSEYAAAFCHFGGQMHTFPLHWEDGFLPQHTLLQAIEELHPDVLFLCTPNNPTGRLFPQALLREVLALCHRRNIRVLLDECFLDFTEGQSMKEQLQDDPQLLILKAFTKSYALAGVRLGYCLSADHALLERMSAAVQPWNVSVLAQSAGAAALQQTEFLLNTRAYLPPQRAYLQKVLVEAGCWVCPSDANYLLFQGPVGLDDALRKEKIAIRSCANYPGLGPGWYRIAVRLQAENEAFAAALQRCM